MMFRRLLVFALVGSFAAACRSDTPPSPIAPSTPGAPVAPPPVFAWTGTITAANWPFSPFGISMALTVDSGVVTGKWSDTPWLDFGGEILGTRQGTTFDGTLSINGCKAAVKGTITDNAVEWTSAGPTEPCDSAALYGRPDPIALKLVASK